MNNLRKFINPYNNKIYYETNGVFKTNSDWTIEYLNPVYKEQYISDTIGIRSLEYCLKYYEEI